MITYIFGSNVKYSQIPDEFWKELGKPNRVSHAARCSLSVNNPCKYEPDTNPSILVAPSVRPSSKCINGLNVSGPTVDPTCIS